MAIFEKTIRNQKFNTLLRKLEQEIPNNSRPAASTQSNPRYPRWRLPRRFDFVFILFASFFQNKKALSSHRTRRKRLFLQTGFISASFRRWKRCPHTHPERGRRCAPGCPPPPCQCSSGEPSGPVPAGGRSFPSQIGNPTTIIESRFCLMFDIPASPDTTKKP